MHSRVACRVPGGSWAGHRACHRTVSEIMEVRLQLPSGGDTLSLPSATATIGDLRAAIADKHKLPAAEQQFLVGFPPAALSSNDDATPLADVGIERGARVLVRHIAPAAGPSGGGGGGRRKPQKVQRLAENAAPPRDEPAVAAAAPPPQAAAAAAAPPPANNEEDSDEEEAEAAANGKEKKKKKKVDPLALTMEAEAKRQKKDGGGGGGGGGGGSSAANSASGVKGKARSAEQLALDFYTSSGSAVSAAVKGGGSSSGDFLSEHGMIEHRVTAITARKYSLEVYGPSGKGKSACASIGASFKAVRRDVCEHVQLLSRDDLKAFLAALASKGSSRRGGTNSHLLRVESMAARSPAVLWSFALAFDGDVSRGVEELLSE